MSFFARRQARPPPVVRVVADMAGGRTSLEVSADRVDVAGPGKRAITIWAAEIVACTTTGSRWAVVTITTTGGTCTVPGLDPDDAHRARAAILAITGPDSGP